MLFVFYMYYLTGAVKNAYMKMLLLRHIYLICRNKKISFYHNCRQRKPSKYLYWFAILTPVINADDRSTYSADDSVVSADWNVVSMINDPL